MLIFHPKYRCYYKNVAYLHKKHILRYVVFINIFLVLLIAGLMHLVSVAKAQQDAYILDRTTLHTVPFSKANGLAGKVPVFTKISLMYVGDINLKEKLFPVYFAVGLTYDKKLLRGVVPHLSLVNGTVRFIKPLQSQHTKDGLMEDIYMIQADVEPRYLLQLYPLDKQLIPLRLMPESASSNYYLEMTGFYNYSTTGSDYILSREGYLNQIESYPINLTRDEGSYYSLFSRIYLLYNHQNVFTYIKNIQYVALSLLLALFALLINSKNNSPLNGRVAVIGGSIFALTANVFQINASIKATSSFTLIDVITLFASIIILTSFLTTIRSLTFFDDDGFETAKTFDVAMFSCLLFYVIGFFVLIYWYL